MIQSCGGVRTEVVKHDANLFRLGVVHVHQFLHAVCEVHARAVLGYLDVALGAVGLCPHLDESAGKKRCTRIRKGAPWLKTTLVQAAWAAIRPKDSYFRSLYGSVKRSSGSSNKAIIAVAASMLTAAYYMLKRAESHRELGSDFRDRRDKLRTAQRLLRRVQSLGFQVHIVQPAA